MGMSPDNGSYRKTARALRALRQRSRTQPLLLEPLEPRQLFNVYTVTTRNDSLINIPAGSLRQAILDANANPGQDTIRFNVANVTRATFSLVGALPVITDSLVIDALTQGGPGYDGPPMVRLDGTTAPANNRAFGLLFQSVGNNAVQGIAFTGWDIAVEFDNSNGGTGNNTFTKNYIGLSTDGVSPFGSKYAGLYLNYSNGNTVSNNVISANGVGTASPGIYDDHGSDNVYIGNFIGTTANGTAPLGNGGDGIFLGEGASNDRIGTDGDGVNDALERNVISSNARNGVRIAGAGANFNTVAGNYIGTDVSGNNSLPNGDTAIAVLDGATGNYIVGGYPNPSVVVSSFASIFINDDLALSSLTLDDGFAFIVTLSPKTVTIGRLSITGGGLLDIGNSSLLLDNAATPIATLQEYWRAGYNMHPYNAGFDDEGAGYYDGSGGITSSVAEGDPSFKQQVGYIDGNVQNIYGFSLHDDLGGPQLATNRILICPVLMGDVNFDGKVDPTDIQVLLGSNKFNKGPGTATDGWIDGDFNGDGEANPTDIQLLLAANTFGTGSLGPALTTAARTSTIARSSVAHSVASAPPASDLPITTFPTAEASKIFPMPPSDIILFAPPVSSRARKLRRFDFSSPTP
jgi:hypothetical protein